ncbi:hypothetical protein K504DRAFT_468194 [Pleomassaria siparia CBS 279.74]|uniref:Uncharacterized protein n=1 Tax=Pleomassaria siparia CBS 279.74 TaxID=1314801 RepID=A0A6G1K9D8_9PLEO|nr:hypothetical protein K504DRAFT_468194 [Pleomassaria siparia CBS 279.74]
MQPLLCAELSHATDMKRGTFKRRLWEHMHRRQSMVLTWETSKLMCPHCRAVEDFTVKNYDRAMKQGLWVGQYGSVDMKLMEQNSDRGCTNSLQVWGKTKTRVLDIMYNTIKFLTEPTTSTSTPKREREISRTYSMKDVDDDNKVDVMDVIPENDVERMNL